VKKGFEEQVPKGMKANVSSFRGIKISGRRHTADSPEASHKQSTSGAPSKDIAEDA